MFRVVIVILVLIKLIDANYSPVLLWGATCTEKPSLKVVDEKEFANCIRTLLKNHMLIIFLESNLSSNDFNCHNKNTMNSCYPHLKLVNPKTFYAEVERPLDTIKMQVFNENMNFSEHLMNLNGDIRDNFTCSISSRHLIEFTDPLTSRESRLLRHDLYIDRLERKMSCLCPIAYVYMSAEQHSTEDSQSELCKATIFRSKRRKRAGAGENGSSSDTGSSNEDSKPQIFKQGRVAISCKSVRVYEKGSSTKYEDKACAGAGIAVTENPKTLVVSLNVKEGDSLEMIFDVSNTEYYLKKVKYKNNDYFDTFRTKTSMNQSFACSAAKMYSKSNGNSLVFEELQFEVGKEKSEVDKFSPSQDCNGIFSTTILMVTMTSGILVVTLLIGIAFMLDIKSNDRLDDPDGPRLLFKAADG